MCILEVYLPIIIQKKVGNQTIPAKKMFPCYQKPTVLSRRLKPIANP